MSSNYKERSRRRGDLAERRRERRAPAPPVKCFARSAGLASEDGPTEWRDTTQQLIYVTLSGLPLRIELEWPFRRSGSGADFYVLHGDLRLESGDGLHCLVAVQMTLTVKEVLPSLDPADVAAPVINILRKEVDRKQLEFQKSPKRVPVPFSARQYSFKRQQWDFARAADNNVAELLRRKVYWNAKLGVARVWIADPVDAQYVTSPTSRLIETAARLREWLRLEGEYATATPALLEDGPKIEAEMRAALIALEKKHAFERG